MKIKISAIVFLFVSSCTIEADVPETFKVDLGDSLDFKNELKSICLASYTDYILFENYCEQKETPVTCEFVSNYQILCNAFLENNDGKLRWKED